MNTDNKSDSTLGDILEELDNNLANQPGITTEIGWEAWAEEKQEYYAKAHSQIEALFTDCLPEKKEAKAPYDILELEKAFQNGRSQAIDQAKEQFNKRLGRK